MTALNITELTTAEVAGTGVFDVLMRSAKSHLDQQFTAGRIKGPEYATVYLGSLELAMQTGLAFVLQQRKNDLEAQLLEKQLLLVTQQIANLTAEGLNIPKQGLLIDAQAAHMVKQGQIADAEVLIKAQQVLIAQAELGIAQAKLANIPKEGLLLTAQTAKTTQETTNLVSQELLIDAEAAQKAQQTLLLTQQTANAVTEGLVLTAQKCKLDAEFDLVQTTNLKTIEEKALLAQKVLTERAQVTLLGVDADSVIGRQKALYLAQTNGFTRDAEQKAAKLMADTWSVRRTTDEGTVADATNKLNDVTVGRAIEKLLTGVGA